LGLKKLQYAMNHIIHLNQLQLWLWHPGNSLKREMIVFKFEISARSVAELSRKILHQAAGGPAARTLDRHQHRDRRSLQLTDEQRDRLADTLRLAEALGGEALTIPGVGRRIADDVISFAHANNVTQIIIGKATRSCVVRTRARLCRARSGAARRQYSASM